MFLPNKKQTGFAHFLLLLIIGALVFGFLFLTDTFSLRSKFQLLLKYNPSTSYAIGNAVRGVSGDLWADVVIGKPDFNEITPYTTVNNKLFLPHGVIVDRNVSTNKMYIYDAGNSRILGFDVNKCLSSSSNPLNCSADLVIGQPNTSTSACNGDSGYQSYPNRAPSSASTLCGLNEDQLSTSEGGSGASMAIDTQSSLYVFDAFNHRVLKYNNPFTSDTVADDVWGQSDFTSNKCNKGNSTPDASSLCYT